MTVSMDTINRVLAASYLPAYEAEAETLRAQIKSLAEGRQLRGELLAIQLREVEVLIATARRVLDGVE